MKLDFFTTDCIGVFGAKVELLFKSETGRTYPGIFRVDARDPKNVRVDRHDLVITWEAIDGGRGFRTVEAAKRFAARWAGAAHAQKTFHPRIER